ncbi:conserved hypothetical protein [Ricinus communis]|uniref:Uncharacterized protein n=1 Tax=Ricinus communis TaxID=3988 RepID=B9SXZ6_RICCO|nr:conserved hypothetical protein [Ricinus communis]
MVLNDDREPSRANISDILLEMHVPLHEDEAMLDKILNTASSMATPDRLTGRKVLCLKIKIIVGLSIDIDKDDNNNYYYYDPDDDAALN